MDYGALAEFAIAVFFGLSIAIFTGAISLRLILKPFVGQFLEAYRERNAGRLPPGAREEIEFLQGRITELEAELDDVRAARDFDRQLQSGAGEGPAKLGGRAS